MKREDLLNMLDLGAKEPASGQEQVAITSAAAGDKSATPPPSATALQLDEWGLRRGREVIAGSPRIQQALGWQAEWINEGGSARLDNSKVAEAELATADFHAAAFEPDPQLVESCTDPLRHQFMRQLLETPEYRSLHARTQLDPLASEIAAAHFAESFSALRAEEAKRRPTAEKKAGGSPAAEGSDLAGELAAMRAVARAVTAAAAEVEEAREAAAAAGLGPGSPGANDPKAIAELYRRVRSSPTLRKICELAGRYRRVAQSKQRQKVVHGYDDMVGVVQDNDVGRLLPHELAMLSDPAWELDAMRRLVERQTMCREYRPIEKVAKGPVIVSVDESGSMGGRKGHAAKAIALAMAWIARHQKRWCGLVAYSGDSGHRLLALPPGRWNEMALMDWLEEFIGRGSTLDVPVREMPDFYQRIGAPAGKTDVIFITDAICHVPGEVQGRFLEWKAAAQARLITLVIDERPGDLAAISDEVFQVSSNLDAGEAGVEKVLSI